MAPASPTTRRTQAERTAETTARLLEATAACLIERGYAGTSTVEVCRRAGVSRGALLHHFPTKDDLVAAAVDHVVDLRVEEFLVAMRTVPPETDVVTRLETAIDVLWGIFRGDTAAATIELIVAARTDPELRASVPGVLARLDERVLAAWAELFTEADELPPAYFDIAPAFIFALLDGLAVLHMAGPPGAEAKAANVLLAVKLVVRTMLATDPDTLAQHLTDMLGGTP
jgi:AcrR family transcriptional regulator